MVLGDEVDVLTFDHRVVVTRWRAVSLCVGGPPGFFMPEWEMDIVSSPHEYRFVTASPVAVSTPYGAEFL